MIHDFTDEFFDVALDVFLVVVNVGSGSGLAMAVAAADLLHLVRLPCCIDSSFVAWQEAGNYKL